MSCVCGPLCIKFSKNSEHDGPKYRCSCYEILFELFPFCDIKLYKHTYDDAVQDENTEWFLFVMLLPWDAQQHLHHLLRILPRSFLRWREMWPTNNTIFWCRSFRARRRSTYEMRCRSNVSSVFSTYIINLIMTVIKRCLSFHRPLPFCVGQVCVILKQNNYEYEHYANNTVVGSFTSFCPILTPQPSYIWMRAYFTGH